MDDKLTAKFMSLENIFVIYNVNFVVSFLKVTP